MADLMDELRENSTTLTSKGPNAACEELTNHAAADFTDVFVDIFSALGAESVQTSEVVAT